ncbi:MAG: hypothetical protein WCG21_04135 [Eubacteriales bacterium]
MVPALPFGMIKAAVCVMDKFVQVVVAVKPVSRSRIAYSSPPIRKTVSVERQLFNSSRAIWRMASSPSRCPSVSLTVLK